MHLEAYCKSVRDWNVNGYLLKTMDHLQGQQGALLGQGLHPRGGIVFFILPKSSFTQLTQSLNVGEDIEGFPLMGSTTLM